MKSFKANSKYYIMQLAALLIGSFFAPLYKLGLQMDINLTPENSFFYRMVVLSVILGTYCIINPRQREELKLVFRDKKLFMLLAGLGIMRAVEIILWAYALVDSATFIVNVLDSIIPLYVIIGSFLIYKERTTLRAMIGMAMAIGGIIVVGAFSDGMEGGATASTIILMTFSSILGAVYMLLSRTIRNKIGALTVMLFVFLWGIPMYGGFCVAQGSVMGPIPLIGWLIIIGTAILGSFVGQTVTMYIVKFIKPSHVSMTNLLTPLFSAVVAFFMLGESLSIGVVIGGLVVISGLALYIYLDERDKQETEEQAQIADRLARADAKELEREETCEDTIAAGK